MAGVVRKFTRLVACVKAYSEFENILAIFFHFHET